MRKTLTPVERQIEDEDDDDLVAATPLCDLEYVWFPSFVCFVTVRLSSGRSLL
jgi:hypothetical protein